MTGRITIPSDVADLEADGFSNGEFPVWDVGTDQFVPGTSTHSGGTLLGSAEHTEATDSTHLATSSTVFADAHADLQVAFTVPSSGSVVVLMSAFPHQGSTVLQYWNVRDASGDVAGTSRLVGSEAGRESGFTTYRAIITGLLPGAALTYKWGRRVSSGTGWLLIGPERGPATMEVWGTAADASDPALTAFLAAFVLTEAGAPIENEDGTLLMITPEA